MGICIFVHAFHYNINDVCPIACMDVQERLLACRNAVCRGGIATHITFLVCCFWFHFFVCAMPWDARTLCNLMACLRCSANTRGCDVKKGCLLTAVQGWFANLQYISNQWFANLQYISNQDFTSYTSM